MNAVFTQSDAVAGYRRRSGLTLGEPHCRTTSPEHHNSQRAQDKGGHMPPDGLGRFQITWRYLDPARDGEFIEPDRQKDKAVSYDYS